MKNSICINGMWFHINWSDKKGKDQLGNTWLNTEQPEMENKKILDSVLDAMNEVHRKVSKLNKQQL